MKFELNNLPSSIFISYFFETVFSGELHKFDMNMMFEDRGVYDRLDVLQTKISQLGKESEQMNRWQPLDSDPGPCNVESGHLKYTDQKLFADQCAEGKIYHYNSKYFG